MANIAEIEVMIWDAKPEEKSTLVFLRTDDAFTVSREHDLVELGLEELEASYTVDDGWANLSENRKEAERRIVAELWNRVSTLPVPERRIPVESQEERMERRSFNQYGEEI